MGFTIPIVERHEGTQLTLVHWIPKIATHELLRQLGGLRWEIFSQYDITIPSKGTVMLELGLGIRITRGMCLITLRQYIKDKRYSLQNPIVAEDVDDIIIIIQNISDSDVTINKCDSLCYVLATVLETDLKRKIL